MTDSTKDDQHGVVLVYPPSTTWTGWKRLGAMIGNLLSRYLIAPLEEGRNPHGLGPFTHVGLGRGDEILDARMRNDNGPTVRPSPLCPVEVSRGFDWFDDDNQKLAFDYERALRLAAGRNVPDWQGFTIQGLVWLAVIGTFAEAEAGSFRERVARRYARHVVDHQGLFCSEFVALVLGWSSDPPLITCVDPDRLPKPCDELEDLVTQRYPTYARFADELRQELGVMGSPRELASRRPRRASEAWSDYRALYNRATWTGEGIHQGLQPCPEHNERVLVSIPDELPPFLVGISDLTNSTRLHYNAMRSRPPGHREKRTTC